MWVYANNAVGTLAIGIGPTDTVIQLSPGQYPKFPSLSGGNTFFITLTDAATQSNIEIMLVTATDTNVFTVVRGQDGTSAQAWSANDIVSARSVAQEHTDWFSKTYGGTVAGNTIFNGLVTTNAVVTANANINCAAVIQAAMFNVTA